MRVLSIVCLALVLPQLATAQDTVAPEGDPPPAPPPAEVAPPDPAPAPQAPPPAPPPPPPPQPYQAPPQQYQTPPTYYGYPYGYPPPRVVAPAPPPGAYTPQPSPLLGNGYYRQPYVTPQPYYYYPPPQAYVAPQPQPQAQPYVTPPVTLPPLPPGYSYVPAPLPGIPNTQLAPPADGPTRDALYARLNEVNLKLNALNNQTVSVGGPIFAMVLGYSTMLVAGIVGISAAQDAREINHGHTSARGYYDSGLDFNDDGDVDRGDHNNWVKTSRVGAGLAGAGFLIGISGTVGLRRAVEERNAIETEKRKLKTQQLTIRQQLDYGPAVSQNQYGFSVRGRW